jgi:hypothetical protein
VCKGFGSIHIFNRVRGFVGLGCLRLGLLVCEVASSIHHIRECHLHLLGLGLYDLGDQPHEGSSTPSTHISVLLRSIPWGWLVVSIVCLA